MGYILKRVDGATNLHEALGVKWEDNKICGDNPAAVIILNKGIEDGKNLDVILAEICAICDTPEELAFAMFQTGAKCIEYEQSVRAKSYVEEALGEVLNRMLKDGPIEKMEYTQETKGTPQSGPDVANPAKERAEVSADDVPREGREDSAEDGCNAGPGHA